MSEQQVGCQTPLNWKPVDGEYPVMGTESIMSEKEHGTSSTPVQEELRYGCDHKLADRICNFNRHYAEFSGYFLRTSWLEEIDHSGEATTYFDSNTGKALFHAPVGRSFEEFLRESKAHGWPSFRDEEVNWNHVRVLPDGECVSIDGTHLGHNIPDRKGNRYCINLVSVAGRPPGETP
jgi:peptide methionine sulfoxide reductase MsrB